MEQTQSSLQKTGTNSPKKIFPLHSFRNSERFTDNKTSRRKNEMFDDAVKELLDMCLQYDAELSSKTPKGIMKTHYNENNKSVTDIVVEHSTQNGKDPSTKPCDNEQATNKISTKIKSTSTHPTDPIEELQKKQSHLQSQLDEALLASKTLEAKHKRKLKSNLKERDNSSPDRTLQTVDCSDGSDEEDELIEFQKIENELRVSELNRQLESIQEELRVALYERLLQNTSSNSKAKSNSQTDQAQLINDQKSSYTYDSSPSSSSCSYDPMTSASNSTTFLNSATNSVVKDQNLSDERCDLDETDTETQNEHEESKTTEDDQYGTVNANNEFSTYSSKNMRLTYDLEIKTVSSEELSSKKDITLDASNEESLTPTISRDSVVSSIRSQPSELSNIYNNTTITSTNIPQNVQASSLRNNSANSDLERIEEDEEENQDFYANSIRFRTIYEEKLHPNIYGLQSLNQNLDLDEYVSTSKTRTHLNEQKLYGNHNQEVLENYYQSSNIVQANCEQPGTGFFRNNGLKETHNSVNSKRHIATNRPLTLYLPKPNEKIDLVEHIQALGHDLDIISGDLKLSTTSAQGYLWKSCSNNNKKWLKRYFHFDRSVKVLSYYECQANLVKNGNSPKSRIPFEEINDVYVDHKLSGLGEKDRSRKRHYVFVLATDQRKYLLASSRAETMRAWIDILFTASKANDYFHEDANEEEDYDELIGGLAVSEI